jgi:threonine dehydratase
MIMIKSIPTEAFDFLGAAERLSKVVRKIPLEYNTRLSRLYDCNVYLKREDLQLVRSYKIRGAYNMMSALSADDRKRGVVCASAGNHAQGFAYSCNAMHVKGVVFMPIVTPNQKVKQVKMFGEQWVEIKIVGDTFDDCAAEAQRYTEAHHMVFIPPFDDPKIIEGQGTVGVEIFQQLPEIDYLFIPVGGGGLASGVGIYFKTNSPDTKLIGVEPAGAPSMLRAFEAGHPVTLREIDRFVDGAAVKRVGDLTYAICREVLDKIHLVQEGKVCSTILKLYNENAIVVEPAGALSVAALDDFAAEIRGKNVVCIISGSNNDIDRMQEIKERSLFYEGLKHYFIVRFVQRPGALKEFVNDVLGPDDDITRFEYIKKHNKEAGPALVGVELKNREDYEKLIRNLQKYNISYTEINKDDNLFGHMV